MVGTTLGHYQILRLLGSGGMGEVYAAEDTKLGRQVALKVLPQLVADDPERRRRFEQEARAVAALNHPSIVTLHSVEEASGTLFLTMELVDGRPLDELLPKGGLPLQRLLRIAIPLADALAAAHDRGITHRDLKPANVMVTADDRVKVLDFGLAKLRETAKWPEAGSALPTRDLTGEGRILGTIAYMSPEQAEGKAIDHRSDLFSFGIVLYQMATGQRPFRGDTNVSIISAIIKDTPHSVGDLRQDLPRDLTRIVKRCLVKDPEHRYQTAKDLRNDLELLKEEIDSGELSSTAAAVAPARRSRWSTGRVAAAVVLAGLVVGAAGWGIWRLRGPGASPPADRYRDVKITRLTTSGKAYIATISRDGKYAAYADADGSTQTVWLRQVATRSNVQIVPPFEGRIEGLTFSPEGNHVYYVMYAKGENVAWLYQVPVLGGTPRKVLNDVDSAPAFSPDGKRIAFLRGYQKEGQAAVLVANVDGTGERKLATSNVPEIFDLRNVAWSPDGKTIVVLKPALTPVRSMYFLAVDAESGQTTPIGSQRWTGISSIAWVPDGTALLATAFDRDRGPGSQVWLVSYPDGHGRKITNDLNGYFRVSVTADGGTLLSMQGDAMANMWRVPGGDARRAVQITSGTKFAGGGGIDWTPDGRIVYVSSESGNADIWIMNADGTNVKQLTVDPMGDFNPMVSPDGRFVVFSSNRGGQSELWRMDLDGGNLTQLTKGVQPGGRAFIDGGKGLIYTSFASSPRSTWKIPSEGGEATRVFAPDAQGGEPLPVIGVLGASPDGTIILVSYLDREQRGFRQATLSLADGKVLNRFNLRGPITWSPDGRALHYPDFKSGVWNIWSQPIDGGPAKPVTNFTNEEIFAFAWSRDGKQLACTRGTSTNDVVLISSLP